MFTGRIEAPVPWGKESTHWKRPRVHSIKHNLLHVWVWQWGCVGEHGQGKLFWVRLMLGFKGEVEMVWWGEKYSNQKKYHIWWSFQKTWRSCGMSETWRVSTGVGWAGEAGRGCARQSLTDQVTWRSAQGPAAVQPLRSCSTLCDPMDYSRPGSSVLYHLPEFAQIHVHWLNDAI